MPKPMNNNVSNTDRPLVRDSIPAEQVAGLAPDDQRNAEAASLQAMHSALGHQADGLDGEHGQRLEAMGYVSRAELDAILAEHARQMQSVMAVFEMFQKNDPRRGGLTSQSELAKDQQILEDNIRELKTAAKVPIQITPLPYEAEAIAAHGGEPLYRVIQLNSVVVYVPVGQIAYVPWQIADVLKHGQEGFGGKWRPKNGVANVPTLVFDGQPAQDLDTIPRPEARPWADSTGRSGVVGQGAFHGFSSGPRVELDRR
jgi:hypothetical protein